MTDPKPTRSNYGADLAFKGLRFPKIALKQLLRAGVYCNPSVSLEYQQGTKKYVLRGMESGGAVATIGCYCSFTNLTGAPISWLSRVNSVGRNGLHGIVIEETFVRLHMFRTDTTYELLISSHLLQSAKGRLRPELVNTVLFHGIHGSLALELWDRDQAFRGQVLPTFYDLSGEPLLIPQPFQFASRQLVVGANCRGCSHNHLLQPYRSEINAG